MIQLDICLLYVQKLVMNYERYMCDVDGLKFNIHIRLDAEYLDSLLHIKD